VKRPTLTPKYRTTRAHYRWACENPDISDPWIMWNDDFYLLHPIDKLPPIHRGRNDQVLPAFAAWHSKWAEGLRQTDAKLKRMMPGVVLYNYDIHTPLLVHKRHMRRALATAEAMRIAAPQVRTLYGNLAHLGGTQLRDPKFYAANAVPAGTTWLSSHEATFTKAIEPHLRQAGLTGHSPFEIPGVPDHAQNRNPKASDARYSARKRRMRYRVLKTPTGNRVVPEQPAPARAVNTIGRRR
jgi:hypothetical protein